MTMLILYFLEGCTIYDKCDLFTFFEYYDNIKKGIILDKSYYNKYKRIDESMNCKVIVYRRVNVNEFRRIKKRYFNKK